MLSNYNANQSNKLCCLSTDEKPKNCLNGQKLIEMDSGKTYHFDAASNNWIEWPSSGGGGGGDGGSDVSILITHPDPDTGVLDKTWQEIRDADIAFIKDTTVTEYDNTNICFPITSTWLADDKYHLVAVDDAAHYWDADTTDDYPYPVEEEEGE